MNWNGLRFSTNLRFLMKTHSIQWKYQVLLLTLEVEANGFSSIFCSQQSKVSIPMLQTEIAWGFFILFFNWLALFLFFGMKHPFSRTLTSFIYDCTVSFKYLKFNHFACKLFRFSFVVWKSDFYSFNCLHLSRLFNCREHVNAVRNKN